MAQIQSPETYVDGQQVTATRLNNQTNGAILLPGAVTDQTAISGSIASGDSVLVHDLSASALRKATVTELLGGGVPVITSAIAGSSGADLTITPAAGQKVDIVGNAEVDDINVTDDLTVGGDAAVTGTLLVTGSSTLTGNVIADNGFTSNGIANFTGQLQVNGTVGYVLTEIVEETITKYTNNFFPTTWTSAWTSASYAKTSGEIWIVEAVFNFTHLAENPAAIRLKQTSTSLIMDGLFDIEGGGTSYFHPDRSVFKYTFGTAVTFTSTFTIDAINANGGEMFELGSTTCPLGGVFVGETIPVSKFRIYKYKTA
jgi:hypothetical protein